MVGSQSSKRRPSPGRPSEGGKVSWSQDKEGLITVAALESRLPGSGKNGRTGSPVDCDVPRGRVLHGSDGEDGARVKTTKFGK